MNIFPATKTLTAIDECIRKDGGAQFRVWLGRVIPHMDDAYRADDFPFRTHMGASGIGDECARKVWYGFRWLALPTFPPRILRLFNRGHLEEARFIALLLMIGVEVFQQDENGKQFRISDAGGHFGGSGDGIGLNVPDIPAGQYALLEFKTASDKKFKKFKTKGIKETEPKYYTQMQVYMRKMNINYSLFMVVNKNDDDLYAAIVTLDPEHADEYIDRGRNLVFYRQAPQRINENPTVFVCRYCDYRNQCHGVGLKDERTPHKNCRTCHFSVPHVDGKWYCCKGEPVELSKDQQLAACGEYVVKEGLV